jgi:hypothetical protein
MRVININHTRFNFDKVKLSQLKKALSFMRLHTASRLIVLPDYDIWQRSEPVTIYSNYCLISKV